jgi:predicted nucleic acid-binding protein
MTRIVVLDSAPLGLLTQRRGVPIADACKQWMANLAAKNIRFIVPEIADYEIRRELLRARKSAGIARLDSFNAAEPDRYIALTTVAVRLAADLWAKARQQGKPTAADPALDADVLIAAQALTLDLPDIVIATTNPSHLSRFVPADLWNNIS